LAHKAHRTWTSIEGQENCKSSFCGLKRAKDENVTNRSF